MSGDLRAPRLLSVVNQFPTESETFIERKARALIASGFDVTVAASSTGRSSEASEHPPVPMLALPRVRSPRSCMAALAALRGTSTSPRRAAELGRRLGRNYPLLPVAAGGYDIIHFEFSGIAAQAIEALPLLRPALLSVSCRGAAEQITPHRDPARAGRLARVFEEVDLIHCVSSNMAETARALGAPAEKILINRPAVDTNRWKGIGSLDAELRGTPTHPLRVLSVGRLHWKKGFDDALRAMAEARRAGCNVQYRIAGEGPEREKLLFLRHSLDLQDSVEFLGWQKQSEVEQQLGWADAFLLPSLSEGISNSALEAMAAGVPVVSTRCGGMEEALASPNAGILVDVGQPVQMAEALRSLTEPSRRQTVAGAGESVTRKQFDLRRQAEVFENAYRALLAGRAASGGPAPHNPA